MIIPWNVDRELSGINGVMLLEVLGTSLVHILRVENNVVVGDDVRKVYHAFLFGTSDVDNCFQLVVTECFGD